MGWETRNGKKVYYRKERGADGRVRSIYCGSGERGEQAAREDAERRSTRGGVGNATPKKACADDLPVAAGESSETYNPASEAVAHESLTEIRDIKKEGLPDLRHLKKRETADETREELHGDGARVEPPFTASSLLGFDDALAHVRRAGCGPSALYAQGRVDAPTYLRLLAALKTS